MTSKTFWTLADSETEAEHLEETGGWTLLEKRGWFGPLLEFEWTWAGPPAWSSGLQLLSFGDPDEVEDDKWEGYRDYVCDAADEQPWVAVAALAPRAHRALFEAFFLDFI